MILRLEPVVVAEEKIPFWMYIKLAAAPTNGSIMPGVDKECEGNGATHHFACKCREEYFAGIEKALKVARDNLFYVKVACISHLDPIATGKINVKELQRLVVNALAEIDRIAKESLE